MEWYSPHFPVSTRQDRRAVEPSLASRQNYNFKLPPTELFLFVWRFSENDILSTWIIDIYKNFWKWRGFIMNYSACLHTWRSEWSAQYERRGNLRHIRHHHTAARWRGGGRRGPVWSSSGTWGSSMSHPGTSCLRWRWRWRQDEGSDTTRESWCLSQLIESFTHFSLRHQVLHWDLRLAASVKVLADNCSLLSNLTKELPTEDPIHQPQNCFFIFYFDMRIFSSSWLLSGPWLT